MDAARTSAQESLPNGQEKAKHVLPRLKIPGGTGMNVSELEEQDAKAPTEPSVPDNDALQVPGECPRTPTKPVNQGYLSWKRGSTGSPYCIETNSTTPSPAGRTVER